MDGTTEETTSPEPDTQQEKRKVTHKQQRGEKKVKVGEDPSRVEAAWPRGTVHGKRCANNACPNLATGLRTGSQGVATLQKEHVASEGGQSRRPHHKGRDAA